MKKQDIEKGASYVVEAPGVEQGCRRFGGPAKVTAVAVEVGVSREHSKRLDGVRVRLGEEFRRAYGRDSSKLEVLPAGFEYVVSTAEVERPVRDGDAEGIVQARVERYLRHDRIMAALVALGVRVDPDTWGEDFEARVSADEVTFSVEFFDRWIRRVDPVTVAGDVLAEVDRAKPRDEDEHREAVSMALEEARQGLRVTEAELRAEPAGAGVTEPF